MKNQILTCFAVVALVAASASAQSSKLTHLKDINALTQFVKKETVGSTGSPTRFAPRRISDYSKKGEIKNADEFGTLTGEDGSTWMFKTKLASSSEFEYYLGGADITLYDSNNDSVTTVNYQTPAGMKINEITPFGNLSSKFFDTDSKTVEFLVYAHEVGQNYEQIGHFLVYNTQGELVKEYENLGNIIWFDASEKWDTYQRALFVTQGEDPEGNYTTQIRIMKPASWNTKEPTEEHMFEVCNELTEYSYGPCLNTYKIEGKPYYVLSYYEQPYVGGYDENFEMVLTEDNNYIVEIYNADYQMQERLVIPVTHPEDVYCSLYAVGLYSYNDLVRGDYSEDNAFNVVITRTDVRLDTDDDTYPNTFLVYNADGTLINTIASNVISWKQLTSIRGLEDQVGFICLNGDVETLEMVNVPSCTSAVTFPSTVEGRKISSNYDRYPVGTGFQYVIGAGDATEDEDGSLVASIGWYTTEGSLDHYVDFNLGLNGEYFTPLLESYSLDPFVINTNSSREYIYIAKMRRTDGSDKIDNVLILADDKGNEIKRFSGGDDRVFRMGSIIDYEIGKPRFVVAYSDESLGDFSLDFYDLPFEKFSMGGEGTEENPYIISTAGELRLISDAPTAHYVLNSTIDMNELAPGWTPVPSFSGVLDGRGFNISNLFIDNDDSYSGLFGYLSDDAHITNLGISNATVVVNPGNSYSGTIAGIALQAHLDSVMVNGLCVLENGNVSSIFGGLLGQATVYTSVSSCGIKEADIDLPSVSTVGGIAADIRTSTTIDACLFQGALSARSVVGGIVGTTGKGSTVINCHVNADLNAKETVGGVVGSASRELIKNNLVEGTITATEADMYGNVSAGGVAGVLASEWGKSGDIIVEGNIVAIQSLNTPSDAKAVHRVIGFTIADEEYAIDETPKSDKGLQNNYVSADIAATDTKGESTPDGADYASITRDFLISLGFKYGSSTQEPWTGDDIPHLYFEDTLPSDIQMVPASTPVHQDPARKLIENGRIVIESHGVKYNLYGIHSF